MNQIPVLFKRLTEAAILPQYTTEGDVGFDLRACIPEAVTLAPGESTLIPTGWKIEIPPDYEAQVRPRSGLALKHQLSILNAPGTVDPNFRGGGFGHTGTK